MADSNNRERTEVVTQEQFQSFIENVHQSFKNMDKEFSDDISGVHKRMNSLAGRIADAKCNRETTKNMEKDIDWLIKKVKKLSRKEIKDCLLDMREHVRDLLLDLDDEEDEEDEDEDN